MGLRGVLINVALLKRFISYRSYMTEKLSPSISRTVNGNTPLREKDF
jgi:hypothetical protein